MSKFFKNVQPIVMTVINVPKNVMTHHKISFFLKTIEKLMFFHTIQKRQSVQGDMFVVKEQSHLKVRQTFKISLLDGDHFNVN